MLYLVDWNVLLRLLQRGDPLQWHFERCDPAVAAVPSRRTRPRRGEGDRSTGQRGDAGGAAGRPVLLTWEDERCRARWSGSATPAVNSPQRHGEHRGLRKHGDRSPAQRAPGRMNGLQIDTITVVGRTHYLVPWSWLAAGTATTPCRSSTAATCGSTRRPTAKRGCWR
jgi:hypothetical protein